MVRVFLCPLQLADFLRNRIALVSEILGFAQQLKTLLFGNDKLRQINSSSPTGKGILDSVYIFTDKTGIEHGCSFRNSARPKPSV